MFSFLEPPSSFDATVAKFIELCGGVTSSLLSESQELMIRGDEDLDSVVKNNKGVYWVSEGAITLTFRDKKILAIESGECFALDSLAGESPFVISNELAVKVQFIPLGRISELFLENSDLAVSYVTLQSAYAQVLSELLSTSPLLESPFDPTLVTAQVGETVITEGEEGTEVFTLVKGHLDVTVQGVKVGDIKEGEIFGVIAAFTGGRRTASVVPTVESLIMKLPKVEFDALVRQRPSLVTNLVESMSRTICQLDEKILENQSTAKS